ncbi:unnamed protein product [Commensalibacter communis]|uniref:hypothetical protein n=1 Tax=Commensalibacter communis TaxID=2972786 RepID=UPI0022FF5583|nr:hypothetical protein [Commensalibacter communis]CAI3939188.1 unnamed protein product [Commensalibacter communis]CAI3940465.1 unnamed protein product [Commensalibacter communis]
MYSFNSKLLTLCFVMGLTIVPVQSYAHESHTMHTDPTHCEAPPKEMSSWKEPSSISAAKTSEELSHSTVTINQAVQASLFPTRTVKFVVNPEERGGSVSFAGMVQFNVPTQATYRIITDSRPWVEMVKDGKTIESSKHQHGSKCLGMEKVLDFPLSPGQHTIEFTANGKDTIKFIIVPVSK